MSKIFELNHHHSYWKPRRFCLDKVERPSERCIEIKTTLEKKFPIGVGRKEAGAVTHTPLHCGMAYAYVLI